VCVVGGWGFLHQLHSPPQTPLLRAFPLQQLNIDVWPPLAKSYILIHLVCLWQWLRTDSGHEQLFEKKSFFKKSKTSIKHCWNNTPVHYGFTLVLDEVPSQIQWIHWKIAMTLETTMHFFNGPPQNMSLKVMFIDCCLCLSDCLDSLIAQGGFAISSFPPIWCSPSFSFMGSFSFLELEKK